MTTYKDILLLVDKVSAPLKKIEDNMKGVTDKSEKLRDKIKKVNNQFIAMRPALNKVWGGVMNVTRAFIGLVGSSGVITMGIAKVTEFADNIDKMSQKIGMSTDEYQKWNYVMSINGGNVDSLAMGFKTLTTQIEGVQKGSKNSMKAFAALGVKVKDNNGKLRKQEDVFNDCIRALQKIQNPTQKAMLANRLFGRSAAELRPLLNQSAEAVEELTKNFEKYGLKLSKKEIDNAVKFKDTWATFTMFLQAQTNKALSGLLPKLQEILDKIMAHREAIKNVITGVGTLTLKVFDIMDFLGKHKALLAGILAIFVGLGAVTLWANIVSGITAMTVAMKALGITSNLALAGIPIIIGAIVTAITYLILNWNKVVSAIKSSLKWFTELINKLGVLAYLIPGLGGIKLGSDIAKNINNKITNNSNKTDNRSYNTDRSNTYNYYNTNNTYNSLMPFANAQYSL